MLLNYCRPLSGRIESSHRVARIARMEAGSMFIRTTLAPLALAAVSAATLSVAADQDHTLTPVPELTRQASHEMNATARVPLVQVS